MGENKISWARVSKNICYFLAPFFALILIACITGLVIIDIDIEVEQTTNYYDTRLFSNNYFSSIDNYFPTFIKEESSATEEAILEISSNATIASVDYYGYSSEYDSIAEYYDDVQENVDINGKNRCYLL